MWNVKPSKLCRNHLLGEHYELHKFVGALNKNKNVSFYIENGFMEVHNIRKRHKQLVSEMSRRGYKHNSKLQRFRQFNAGIVDVKKSIRDLKSRCNNCKQRFENE